MCVSFVRKTLTSSSQSSQELRCNPSSPLFCRLSRKVQLYAVHTRQSAPHAVKQPYRKSAAPALQLLTFTRGAACSRASFWPQAALSSAVRPTSGCSARPAGPNLLFARSNGRCWLRSLAARTRSPFLCAETFAYAALLLAAGEPNLLAGAHAAPRKRPRPRKRSKQQVGRVDAPAARCRAASGVCLPKQEASYAAARSTCLCRPTRRAAEPAARPGSSLGFLAETRKVRSLAALQAAAAAPRSLATATRRNPRAFRSLFGGRASRFLQLYP